jgi:hypothetical protein
MSILFPITECVILVLFREKRTDVVKRFEDEIDSLRLQKSELELEMDQMRTEKKKADAKIGELKGRWVLNSLV